MMVQAAKNKMKIAEKMKFYCTKNSSKYPLKLMQHDFFNFRGVGFLGACGVVAIGYSYFGSLAVVVMELCFELNVFLSDFSFDCVRLVFDGGGW